MLKYIVLFYGHKEVLPTGEVIFDITLKNMKTNIKNAEMICKEALDLLNLNYPDKCCEWCEGI